MSLTYDALGRMVEQNRSGVYSQIVYTPTGNKLAIMSGQTLQKAFVSLVAGAQAVYTSAGLSYYRHPDWLGSSRLASTPSRTVYYDGAYAPFGESYAEMGTTSRSFTGQNQDTVTGLYDFMFREYSPVQGRWISPDPAGLSAASAANPQSWNRYAYVGNTPLTAIDPLGLFQNDAVGVLFNNNCYINSVVANCFVAFNWAMVGKGGSLLSLASTPIKYQLKLKIYPGFGCDGGAFYCDAGMYDIKITPIYPSFDPTKFWEDYWNWARQQRQSPRAPNDQDRINALGQAGQIASQAIHPCTIALWYGTSAVGATGAAVRTGGAVFPTLAQTATPWLGAATGTLLKYEPYWLQQGYSYVGQGVEAADRGVQSTCDNLGP